jgi:hypothetical protein
VLGVMAAGFVIGFEWRATFWWGVGCDLKIGVARLFIGLTGPVFTILGDFCGFGSILVNFWGRFFLFSLFFNFEARVSNA